MKKGACHTVGAVRQAAEPGQASRQANDSNVDSTTVIAGVSTMEADDG